jgi:hypothetical protein
VRVILQQHRASLIAAPLCFIGVFAIVSNGAVHKSSSPSIGPTRDEIYPVAQGSATQLVEENCSNLGTGTSYKWSSDAMAC